VSPVRARYIKMEVVRRDKGVSLKFDMVGLGRNGVCLPRRKSRRWGGGWKWQRERNLERGGQVKVEIK